MTEAQGSAMLSAASARRLETLYREHHAAVLRYLVRMSGSRELAEELAQETFIRAAAGLFAFRGDCSVATWLFRIARNCYLNTRRRPNPARIDTDELLAIPDGGSGDPARHYAASERRDLIGLALAQLHERQRSLLLLRDAEGLSYAEIADVLEMSLAAVKVNLFRARNAFRAAYAEFDADHEETN
jgi:RNA polymerase sigma-70 factor (ECF subfamily)